jgi:PST family polysaccharide transporter
MSKNTDPDLLVSRGRWLNGAIWLTAGNITSTALSIAAAVVVARILGPADFGLYSVVVVIVGLGATLASFRLEMHLITRLQSSSRNIDVIHDIVRAAWLLAFVTVTAGVGAALILHLAAPLVVVVAGSEVLLTPLVLGRAVLQGQARQRALVAASLTGRVVWVGGVTAVALVQPGTTLVVILAARVLSLASELILVWRLAAVPIAPTLVLKLLSPRRHLGTIRSAAPLAVAGLAGAAYNRADQLILAGLRGNQITGLYAAGVRFAELLGGVAPIVDSVGLPGLVELDRRGDETGFVRAVRDMTLMMTIPAGIIVVLLLTAGSMLIPLLFGAEYRAVGPIVGLLGVAEWVTLLGSVATSTALARGERGLLVRSTLIGLGVNLLANLALIPRFGGVGAAWACIVGYGVASFYAFTVPALRSPLVAALGAAIRVLAAILAAWSIGSAPLPLGLRILAVLTVYGSVLILLLPSDCQRLRRWLHQALAVRAGKVSHG